MPRRVMAFFAPCSVQRNVLTISASVWLAAVPLVSHLRAEEGRQREERRGRGKKRCRGSSAHARVVVVNLVGRALVLRGNVGGHGGVSGGARGARREEGLVSVPERGAV